MSRALITSVLVLFCVAGTGHAQSDCPAPAAVCAAQTGIFPISSFDPAASATLVAPGLLVTNRHAVADNAGAEVFLPDGRRVSARVMATDYPGDLILLRSDELGDVQPLQTAPPPTADTRLFTVAGDVGRGRVRVYRPGKPISLPADGKPLARLHHTAISQPGNSGGALVDDQGRLVAIVTSGGSGRYEAIPASEIKALRDRSGAQYRDASQHLGLAYRQCTEAVDAAGASRQQMTASNIQFIAERCGASRNRQLLDLAGQALGRRGHYDQSVQLFKTALDQDPNALNARLGLVVTLHLAGRYKDELPHLRMLIAALPADVQVLRFAIQAGTWADAPALADQGVALLKEHHPKLAPLAERFRNTPPPQPRRR